MTGRIESVNVGTTREVEWHGKVFRTAIFKTPVDGPVRMEGIALVGDEQADLTVHGGPTQAVYVYFAAHYDAWRRDLDARAHAVLAVPGAFGENLTVSGLVEADIGVGDRCKVGTAILVATEPRMPCSKLGMRFDDASMVKRFHASGRNGVYFAIERAGEVKAGDPFTVIERHPVRLGLDQLIELRSDRSTDPALRAVAAEHPGLSEELRERFRD